MAGGAGRARGKLRVPIGCQFRFLAPLSNSSTGHAGDKYINENKNLAERKGFEPLIRL